jgi:hypothetical protein
MFDKLKDVYDAITAFFVNIFVFINEGIYDLLTEVFSQLVEWYVIAAIEFKIFVVVFLWGVAENLLANIELSSLINQAWANIDSQLMSYLTFLRIPEALNILLQASVTRFILRLF